MICDTTQLILCVIIVCSNSVYALASLFLPKVFEDKAIESFWVGLIFSMYSIAVVISSPFIGANLSKYGFSNVLAVGLVAMGASIVPFGYIKELESNSLSLLLGLLLRALQGVASASLNTTCFSIAANKYADKTEFIVGLLEGVSGIGAVLGCLGGSVIYESIGYKAVFVCFGGILPIMAIV